MLRDEHETLRYNAVLKGLRLGRSDTVVHPTLLALPGARIQNIFNVTSHISCINSPLADLDISL